MIEVTHLTKRYGDHEAVSDLSFTIKKGVIYGFLGPNGAGKSTTMNIIAGCLGATSGEVRIDGHSILDDPMKARRCIGYLPEIPPVYMDMTVLEYLKFVARAKGVPNAQRKAQLENVMRRTHVLDVQHRLIKNLSKGYRQRVGIAQALLGAPRVIVLDEPTVGLDPIQILEIRGLIRELGKSHTVIFSSHILSEVQAICDRILMIAHGRLMAFGEPEELQRQLLSSGELLLTTDAPEAELRALLAPVEGIRELTLRPDGTDRTQAVLSSAQPELYQLSAAVFRAFAAGKWVLYELSLKKGSLEDVFLELSENSPEEPESAGPEQPAEQEEEQV